LSLFQQAAGSWQQAANLPQSKNPNCQERPVAELGDHGGKRFSRFSVNPEPKKSFTAKTPRSPKI
jgi:hypothetical protein